MSVLRSKTHSRLGLAFRGALAASIAVLGCASAGGCSVDATGSQPSAATAATQGLALGGVCMPLTCCFPSGGGWAADPFEDQLKAHGCAEPHAYAESFGASDWWLYSICPARADVATLAAKYARASPYYSRVAVNACFARRAASGGRLATTIVAWDPTCSACAYSSYFSPSPAILPYAAFEEFSAN